MRSAPAHLPCSLLLLPALSLVACSNDGQPAGSAATIAASLDAGAQAAGDAGDGAARATALTYARDVEPVRSVEEAAAGAFIPPFESCRAPLDDVAGSGPDGQVCTQVSIAGATEEGRYFPDYADCEVVRRQRPYWPADPAAVAPADDGRLQDAAYLADLEWVKSQIGATGCTCCHDGRTVPASQWDIAAGPLWLDSLSDTGLALFSGFADSSVLGAYPPEDVHGFSRDVTGIPTTDPERMRAIMVAELERRGLSEAWARDVPPFGGPIYEASVREPDTCTVGQGITDDGRVVWTGGAARYVYVQEVGASNPGVPPNLDKPEGTLWRLDVRASEPALDSGVAYATTPDGSFQVIPEASAAPALVEGTRYKLVVLYDVGVARINCLFEYGAVQEASPEPSMPDASTGADAGVSTDSGGAERDSGGEACSLAGGDAEGFGATCDVSADCTCAGAPYCAKSPFDATGYCTAPVDSCSGDTSACPDGWGCFDVGIFAAGEPSICERP